MGIEKNLRGNIIKHEAKIDLKKLREFTEIHEPHILTRSRTPIGQDYNFTYTQTSLGVIVSIGCRCKVCKDITDYTNW